MIWEVIIDNIKEYTMHELSHLKANDESSWNEEFYTDGKLDYKKLCIKFLEDIDAMTTKGNNKIKEAE